MTSIAIYGGPKKGEIVQAAYEICGQAGFEYELTPEEYAAALRRLDGLMSQWKGQRGVDLGYNFSGYGTGRPEEESGIPDDCFEAVVGSLARLVAPGIGKTLSAEANAQHATAGSLMLSAHTVIPTMTLRTSTPRGAGNRWGVDFGAYVSGTD